MQLFVESENIKNNYQQLHDNYLVLVSTSLLHLLLSDDLGKDVIVLTQKGLVAPNDKKTTNISTTKL